MFARIFAGNCNVELLSDGRCHTQNYFESCNFDGGDCDSCPKKDLINNGACDFELSGLEECSYDDYDCNPFVNPVDPIEVGNEYLDISDISDIPDYQDIYDDCPN